MSRRNSPPQNEAGLALTLRCFVYTCYGCQTFAFSARLGGGAPCAIFYVMGEYNFDFLDGMSECFLYRFIIRARRGGCQVTSVTFERELQTLPPELQDKVCCLGIVFCFRIGLAGEQERLAERKQSTRLESCDRFRIVRGTVFGYQS